MISLFIVMAIKFKFCFTENFFYTLINLINNDRIFSVNFTVSQTKFMGNALELSCYIHLLFSFNQSLVLLAVLLYHL